MMTQEERREKVKKFGKVVATGLLILVAINVVMWMTDGIKSWAKGSPQPVVIKYPRPEPPEAPSISVPATNTIYMSSAIIINNPLGPRQKIRAEIVGDDKGVTYTMTRVVGKREVSLPMFPAGDDRNPGLIVANYDALKFQLDPTNLKNPHTAKLRYWFE